MSYPDQWDVRRRAMRATCEELIRGDGTSESHQRAIDMARIALGIEKADLAALDALVDEGKRAVMEDI